jgi:hypothetical protein
LKEEDEEEEEDDDDRNWVANVVVVKSVHSALLIKDSKRNGHAQ